MTVMPVKLIGYIQEVLAVVSDRWQTSTMIASQIAWPPEAIARQRINRNAGRHKVKSNESITSSFAARSLLVLVKTGRCERQPVANPAPGSGAKYEYRLKPVEKPKGWKMREVRAAFMAGENAYAIEGIPPSTVAAYLWRLRKAETGR